MILRGWIVAFCSALLLGQSASAHTLYFTTTMSGAQENPVNDSFGVGSSLVTIDTDLFTMQVEATFSGLTGTTSAAHIHCCQIPPTNAIVATITPTFTGFPLGVNSGTYSHIFDMTLASNYNAAFITANGGTVSSAFQALLSALENEGATRAYFNIHTSYRAGGEIRGFFAPVPEPVTGSLVLLGLGVPILLRRFVRIP